MEPKPQTLTPFSRHYYIQKRYQSKMIFKFCLLTLIGSVFFCGMFYLTMNRDLSGSYSQALEDLRFIKGGIVKTFIVTEGTMLLIVGAGVVIMTLLMSHRIAGPLWRIENTARAVGSGDLSAEIRLRSNDEMKNLADQMNRMVADLRARVGEVNETYRRIESKMSQLEEIQSDEGVADKKSITLVREILETSKTLLAELDSIKTL